MKTRSLVTALSATALALSVAGCAKDDTSTTTESGIELVKDGTLTICTHLPYEPFEFTEGGEVVGFDPAVLEIAAKANGLEHRGPRRRRGRRSPRARPSTPASATSGAGAMTINAEREAVMDFTDPYFKATQALMTKTGSGITSLEDLAGKKVAVQDGTTGADYVRENAPEDTEIISFEDSSLMQQAVLTGKIDAGVNDNGLLNYFVSQNPDVEVVTEFQTGEEYGFSVKKDGNDELLAGHQRGDRERRRTTRSTRSGSAPLPPSDCPAPPRR